MRMTSKPLAPYRAKLLGSLGDDPASVAEIIGAGFDPGAPGVTYTVDDAGNVMQNITVTAPISSAGTGSVAAQKPIWPLLAVLGLVAVGVFESGRRSR